MMEIYEAIADFTPDTVDSCQNVLTFQTGDKFVAVECSSSDFSKFNNGEWFGARALKNNEIGYVPTSYVQLEQTIRTIYSDETKAKSLPTTPADDMQRNFLSQENIFMEPHPDYLLDDGSDSYYGDETDYHPANGGVDGDLIRPRKLINPCLQSKERRDLHKELLFNHKHGKNVLKKPELEKVLQQRKEAQRMKEWDEQKCVKKRTSLELMLEERKNRLSQEEDKSDKLKHGGSAEVENRPEYLKIHAKIQAKMAANSSKME